MNINSVKKASRHLNAQGFTIIETLVAIGASTLLIGGAAVGMKNLQSTMKHSSNLSSLRSHAVTGLRLLRSEVQKSQHLMVYGGQHDKGLDHTDLGNSIYRSALNQCGSQRIPGGVFKPLFGLKSQNISDVRDVVVIYGYGVSRNKQNYALLRCGEALGGNGSYTKNSLAITPILEGIGLVNGGESRLNKQTTDVSRSITQFASGINTRLDSNNESPPASINQPALGIKTDKQRRVLELIDPTRSGDHIDESFLQAPGARTGRVDLKLVAFARSHPISKINDTTYGKGPCFYGICSGGGGLSAYQGLMFVVDISGSMGWRQRGQTQTPMAKLKSELKKTINELPDGATLSFSEFNSYERCYKGCKMITINTQTKNELLRHIDQMRAGGGTRPWNALNRAVENPEGRKLYFMTDGMPSGCSYYRGCSSSIYTPYVTKSQQTSQQRPEKIVINTINAGPRMTWLEDFAKRGGGTYKFV